MPFISITRLRVRSWRFLPSFFIQAVLSARQARAAAGNLGVSVLRESGNVFWTRTLWNSEFSMRSYMLAGAHRRVMPSLLKWCDEAAVAHWTNEPPQPPDWQEAHRQLVGIGRLSKVLHPSEAQRLFQIPAPQVPPGKELRWK
jgi:heme-degrading monooxygenase HmoA